MDSIQLNKTVPCSVTLGLDPVPGIIQGPQQVNSKMYPLGGSDAYNAAWETATSLPGKVSADLQ